MTRYEAQAKHGYGGGKVARSDWSQILIPIVAAILVIALGLALVGLTKGPGTQAVPPPATSGAF